MLLQPMLLRLAWTFLIGAALGFAQFQPPPGSAGSGGTSSNFGSAFPAAGTAAGFKDTNGNMSAGLLDMSGNLLVSFANSSLAVTQLGPWTVQQGTPPWSVSQSGSPWGVSGIVTANQGAANATPWNENLADVGGAAFALGQQLAAASLPVVMTAAQLAALTPLATVTVNQGTANATPWNQNLSQVGGVAFALGQQLAAASLPVVMTAAQLAALTPLATVTVNQGSANATPWNMNVAQVGGAAFALGQQLAAASVPVVMTAAQLATLTPLATVTVNQGSANATPWNQNLAQVGGSAFALGQQLAAASLPVVLTAGQLATLTPLATVTANQGGAPWSVSQSGSPWSVSGTVTANQGGAPWSVSQSGAFNVTTTPSMSFGATFPATGTAAGFKDPNNNMQGGGLDLYNDLKTVCVNCAPQVSGPILGPPQVAAVIAGGPFGQKASVQGGALSIYQAYPPADYDRCKGARKFNVPVSVTANTQLAPGIDGATLKICSIVLISTSAESFSVVGGTGTLCATNTEAVIGSTTAANGPAASANGGFAHGDGQGTVFQSNIAGNNLCIFLSGATLISGGMMVAY